MAKIDFEHKDDSKFPCFGIDIDSNGIIAVEFKEEGTGVVIVDTRPHGFEITGVFEHDFKPLDQWHKITKEFKLKFTV